VPPHGNWEGEIPEVHRWAYDYDKDERGYILQTEPVGEAEMAEPHTVGSKKSIS
jgi:cytochrome c oxidase subunit 1